MEGQRGGLVTVERAAYGAIALVAAGLRWSQLGLSPLSPAEAVQALSAYRFVNGSAAGTPSGTIPALLTANAAAFTIAGSSDATARWLPALAGMVLVLLPYGLRHRLGRGGALAASALLALSPSAVYFSRLLDGSILVATCGLGLAVALIWALDFRRPTALYWAAAALATGLLSGPAFVSLLLVFITFAILLNLGVRLRRRSGNWPAWREAWVSMRDRNHVPAKVAGVLAAVFFLVATTFALNMAGIGNFADLLGGWVEGFRAGPDGRPFAYPLFLLLRYEVLIVFFGLLEAVLAGFQSGAFSAQAQSDNPSPRLHGAVDGFQHTTFLTYWFVAGLVLSLAAGRRSGGDLLLAVVPLALLAGQFVARAWLWVRRRTEPREVGIVTCIALVLAVFFYLQITAYSLAGDESVVSLGRGVELHMTTAYLLLALLAIVLLLALGAVAWLWRGPRTFWASSWLSLTLVLGMWGLKSAWGVSHLHAADPREPMIARATAPEVRDLLRQIERLSLDTAGDIHSLQVTVTTDTGPVIEWYMRAFGRAVLVERISGPPDTTAAVTLAQQDLPIGEAFRGEGYPLRTSASPWGLNSKDWVRRLLFGGGPLPVVEQQVVLWVVSP